MLTIVNIFFKEENMYITLLWIFNLAKRLTRMKGLVGDLKTNTRTSSSTIRSASRTCEARARRRRCSRRRRRCQSRKLPANFH